jgi:peptidoglycan/xylan/chitin deacetylase (PgdA/CDA1 family)
VTNTDGLGTTALFPWIRLAHVLEGGIFREDVMKMAGLARFHGGLARLPRRGFAFAAAMIATVSLAAGGVAAWGAGASAATPPVPPGLGGRNWTVIPATPKVAALTFDAGANADAVPSILKTLSSTRTPASFFLTGNFVRDFPAASKAIAASGARIGDHSVSHPYFTKLTDAQIRDQVLATQSKIKQVTGADPWPWFRFPFGDLNQHAISVVNSVGFAPVGWTVDTLGWKGTSGGITTQMIVNRVLAGLRPGEVVLMHCGSNPDDHSTLDAAALPAIIKNMRDRGYSFVTIDALRGLGYHIATSNGGVYSFGLPGYGSAAGSLGAARAVGLAVDPKTGGYWILKSNGGVANYNAPWYGSLTGKIPAGQRVTAIAATSSGGYLVATSNGAVYGFEAGWKWSAAGNLGTAKAVGLAVDPKTGGYWILKSNGGVATYKHAPWHGSLTGKLPPGQSVTAIAATSSGGYLVLISNGGVANFGVPWYGSDAGKLPAGVTATALAADPVTGGYWILKSTGGVDNYNAPWYGSLAGKLAVGQAVTAIAGG